MLNENPERACVAAEIERYAAWPGQRSAYKLARLRSRTCARERNDNPEASAPTAPSHGGGVAGPRCRRPSGRQR